MRPFPVSRSEAASAESCPGPTEAYAHLMPNFAFGSFPSNQLSCLLCGLSSVLLCGLCKKPGVITWWNTTEFGILNCFLVLSALLFHWRRRILWKDTTPSCAFITLTHSHSFIHAMSSSWLPSLRQTPQGLTYTEVNEIPGILGLMKLIF